MDKIKLLITGSEGQLGKCIIDCIEENDFAIDYTALDHSSLDITNSNQVRSKLADQKYDYLINCAAYTNVVNSELYAEESALLINGYGVKSLAECCAESNTKLIHISTDYVYDGSPGIKTETSSVNPLNKYGKSKLLGEQEIISSAEKTGLDYMIIRTAALYSEYGTNFVNTIFGKLNSGNDCYVVYDQITSPTNAHHLADFIINHIIHKNNFNVGIFNYTDICSMSWYDLAAIIHEFLRSTGKVIGNLYPVETNLEEQKVRRPMINILSNRKVIEKYGSDAVYNLSGGLINILTTILSLQNGYCDQHVEKSNTDNWWCRFYRESCH